MKALTNRSNQTLLALLTLALAMGFSQTVMAAAGVAAGTVVSNQASVDYDVNSIAQDTITSAAETFIVDTKVDFTVTTDEVAAVNVTPGSNDNVLIFTVDNTGNATFDFTLASEALSGGAAKFAGTDNINASTVDIFVDGNANGVYNVGVDTATSIDDLAAGKSIKVFIVSDFANGLTNDDIASYYLVATAKDSAGAALDDDSGSGDDPDTQENVFATDDGPATGDADKDVIDSDYADYQVAAAEITITKVSSVVSDPVNSTTNPKAIPGAVIEYLITVSNGGTGESATAVAVSDSLNTEIATNGNIAFNTQYDADALRGIKIGHPDYSGGAETEYKNDGSETLGGVNADWNVTTANTVTVTGITLDAGESATIKFRVTVQ